MAYRQNETLKAIVAEEKAKPALYDFVSDDGIRYIEKPESLAAMRKELPVFFIAGGDDPVGNYGKGVRQSADAFRKAGMADVSMHIYPLCRHEILNEINREEVYGDILQWLSSHMKKSSPST